MAPISPLASCAYRFAGVRPSAVLARSILLVAAASSANADSTLDAGIAETVGQIVKGDRCAHENEEARRTHFFDLDNNGRNDAVVLMTIEGFGCGNNSTFHMAAFLNGGKAYRPMAHVAIGGTWGAHPDFEHVAYRDGQIVLQVKVHAENDAACCPSQKRTAFYAIQGGKLVEARGQKR
jgi:hypothetical protein